MIGRLVKSIEGMQLTAAGFLGAFLSIVTIRVALEGVSSPSGSGFLPLDPLTIVHYGAYFLALYLVLSLVVGAYTGSYRTAANVLLFGLVVLWIPPLIDLVFTGGAPLRYILATPTVLLDLFLTYFGPLEGSGATLGIRVALLLMLVFVCWYVYQAKKHILTAVLAAISVYAVVFVFGSFPSILYLVAGGFDTSVFFGSVSTFLHEAILGSGLLRNALPQTVVPVSSVVVFETGFSLLLTGAFFVIACIAGLLLFRAIDARAFRAHLKNARPIRILHFLVLVGAGALAGYLAGGPYLYGWPDVLGFVCLLLSWCAACVFAICVNDLEDETIDAVSNADRPLVTKALSRTDMQQAAIVSFVFMLVGAWAAGSYSFFFVLAFTASYYAYSASPLRLKRVPGLSSLLIGFATLFAVCAGFFFTIPNKTGDAFPLAWIFGVIVFYTLYANFKDLKDLKGDEAGDVTTLATLMQQRFGERGAFQVLGAVTGAAFLSTPLFFDVPYLWFVAVPAALVAFLACTLSPYKERRVFLTLFAFLLAFAFLTLR